MLHSPESCATIFTVQDFGGNMKGLQSAQAIQALERWRESGEKAVRRNPVEKLQMNPTSLRKAITAFCWLCVGEDRKEVTNCTATKCPLYNVRPWQPNTTTEDTEDET